MYLNAKLCSFPPQAIKTSEKQRERSSIDRSFVRSPLPAIIIRRHPRVEPLFRGERDRTEGGRKENGEKRRDADLEAFTTTRASPIVILSLSRSPRGRTSDFIGRSRRMTFADTLAVGRRKIVDWLAPLRSNENVLFENYNLNKRG